MKLQPWKPTTNISGLETVCLLPEAPKEKHMSQHVHPSVSTLPREVWNERQGQSVLCQVSVDYVVNQVKVRKLYSDSNNKGTESVWEQIDGIH